MTSHMRRAGSGLVDLAEHQAVVVADVVGRSGHSRQTNLVRSVSVLAGDLGFAHREGELPVRVLAHGLHEFVGDQQRQVELAQPPGLALGADEFHRVGMADVERAHLRAAAAAGRRHREAHLVVDIHERQRARGVGARAGHVGAARAQRREFVADAAAGLQREARLVHLAEDVVHRVADGAGHGAVDRRGGGLVLLRAGVRGDAAGRDRAAAQRPQEPLVPGLADLGASRRRPAHGRHACRCRPSTGRSACRPWRSGGTSCPRCRARLPGTGCCAHHGIAISRRCSLRQHGSPAHGSCRSDWKKRSPYDGRRPGLVWRQVRREPVRPRREVSSERPCIPPEVALTPDTTCRVRRRKTMHRPDARQLLLAAADALR